MNPNFKIFYNILGTVGSAKEFHGIAFNYLLTNIKLDVPTGFNSILFNVDFFLAIP